MSFADNPVLGKFTENVSAISRSIDAKQEELRAAYQMIDRLKNDLLEVREYLEDEVDVMDGDNGPLPNRAMALVIMIDETLHGPGAF